MSELLVFPGGWPALDYSGWDTDDAYEADLRICRDLGHDLLAEFHGGFEVLVCSRCSTRFEEQP